MKSPGITTTLNGKNKTLYMQTVKSIEQKTKENLKKTLSGKPLSLSVSQVCACVCVCVGKNIIIIMYHMSCIMLLINIKN